MGRKGKLSALPRTIGQSNLSPIIGRTRLIDRRQFITNKLLRLHRAFLSNFRSNVTQGVRHIYVRCSILHFCAKKKEKMHVFTPRSTFHDEEKRLLPKEFTSDILPLN